MEEQGYTIETNVLYQDNKSTILLDKNGRMSAGKNSKHIKNRDCLRAGAHMFQNCHLLELLLDSGVGTLCKWFLPLLDVVLINEGYP